MERLGEDFFRRDCLTVAQDLVGKLLVRQLPTGEIRTMRITETEAYCGEADTACHAHRGRTRRTEVLYAPAGTLYVYLCYGIHWLLNIVTGQEGQPEAVLIRACREAPGPGRLTKALEITGEFNRGSITQGSALWIGEDSFCCRVRRDRRVGIDYAAPEDRDRLWRFLLAEECPREPEAP